MKTPGILVLYSTILLLTLSSGCRKEEMLEETDTSGNYPDWTEETHSNTVSPNYSIVFNQDEVLRLDINISSSDWSDMQKNLNSMDRRSGADPIWVPCTLTFMDKDWYNVGIRYKGNSSLFSTMQSGIDKLPLKLDFDQFEDDYPALKNQRFYGFKQLNLKNNYLDYSFLREKVVADLFRAFGIVSSQTSFCEVYIDYGKGSEYFGLYTLVEEVDDSVIKNQLDNDEGNLYKPEDSGATFAKNTFNTSDMNRKNNEETNDYSDVESLYNTLNSDLRTTDTDSWKTSLESVLDVPNFLKWLASNTIIQNWDTYGIMPHNYYLYNNYGKLLWIPWDNNEALKSSGPSGNGPSALSLSLTEVGNHWPLIRYLMDDPEYEAQYKEYLSEFVDNYFEPVTLSAFIDKYSMLIESSVEQEETGYTFLNNTSQFYTATDELKNYIQSRTETVREFIINE